MNIELIAVTPEAERIIEEAARTCYKSLDKMKPGSGSGFLRGLINSGHLSVFEHASATFRISGVSRALTHQLVRHRVCSFSQQSQRYVSEKDFSYVIPPSIAESPEASEFYGEVMSRLGGDYEKLINMGIRKEDARYVLPNSCFSEIVMTANFRELRHMLSLRGDKKAQWEIRELFIGILRILKESAPGCFNDMAVDEKERIIIFKEE